VKDPILYFTGRHQELETIEKLFEKNKSVVLVGLGGIGKTQLSRYFEEKHKDQYEITFEINIENRKFAEKSLKNLLSFLAFSQGVALKELQKFQDFGEKEILDLLKRYSLEYAHVPTLILIDGLNDPEAIFAVKEYLDIFPKDWRFLITSRLREAPYVFDAGELSLTKGLATDEAANYLMNFTGEADLNRAQQIAVRLKNFPLALGHAANFMKAKKISMEDYFKRLDTLKVQGDKHITIPGCYDKTIYKTWQISLDVIKKENPFVTEFIRFISICNEIPLRTHFLDTWLKRFHPQQVDDHDGTPVLKVLYQHSLLERMDDETYAIHPLFQEIIKEDLKQNQKELARLKSERDQVLDEMKA